MSGKKEELKDILWDRKKDFTYQIGFGGEKWLKLDGITIHRNMLGAIMLSINSGESVNLSKDEISTCKLMLAYHESLHNENIKKQIIDKLQGK